MADKWERYGIIVCVTCLMMFAINEITGGYLSFSTLLLSAFSILGLLAMLLHRSS